MWGRLSSLPVVSLNENVRLESLTHDQKLSPQAPGN